jgi:UDP-4-amino-4-deoxy-L-arabinose formyltransferase/UDP-glucuronic acid dehydrogenase (UDP-4-keto-hexauronic acid decarboxylating)
MRILIVAEESPGVQLLRALAQSSGEIVAVMTTIDDTARISDVASVARKMGVEVWPAQRVRDAELVNTIRAERVDLLLNAHSLYIYHPAVLTAPRLGAFNLHPGPLPEYAGLNCPSWAILQGEKSYGVTVHRIVERIDAGTIAYQSRFDLDAEETALSLSVKCIRAGVPLLLQLVAAARTDPSSIPITEQDLTARRYFGREVPRAGALTWSLPASQVVSFVRAFDYHPFRSPWGRAHARLNDERIDVIKVKRTGQSSSATPGTLRCAESGEVQVATADEWIALGLLQRGGEHVAASEALAGAQRLEDGQ